MATKKSAASTKKSTKKKPTSKTTSSATNVTTVKATSTKKTARTAKKPTKTMTTVQPETVSPTYAQPSTKKRRLSNASLISIAVAEFIGTFLLAAVYLISRGEPVYLLFAAIGIVLTVGTLSGAHLNPALTVGAWVTRKIKAPSALVMIVGQILGAMLALVLVQIYVGMAPEASEQQQAFGQPAAVEVFKTSAVPAGAEAGFLIAELIGVTILAFAVAGAAKSIRERSGVALAYGGAFFVALIITAALVKYIVDPAVAASTIAVLNPAVAVSVQAVMGNLWTLVVYIVAPIIGGILGFGLHDLLSVKDEDPTATV